MANYSFEKGKHGGPCGVIFPFFREINGLIPLDQDYRDFVPAGFLKCRGQILQADQFPALAELLGVGATCIYRKEGTILQERNSNGTGGTFQLPDLGSKYITSSSNPGQYLNDTTIDRDTNSTIQRAGIAVQLESGGDTVEFSYTGNFRAPAVTLTFSGTWRVVSPASSTEETTLGITNFVAHGHTGTYTIGRRVNQNNRAIRFATWNEVFLICENNGNFGEGDLNPGVQHQVITFNDSGEDLPHAHQIGPPVLTVSGPTGSIPELTLSSSSITTLVNVRTTEIYKMDDIAPKFILCEYLIKF